MKTNNFIFSILSVTIGQKKHRRKYNYGQHILVNTTWMRSKHFSDRVMMKFKTFFNTCIRQIFALEINVSLVTDKLSLSTFSKPRESVIKIDSIYFSKYFMLFYLSWGCQCGNVFPSDSFDKGWTFILAKVKTRRVKARSPLSAIEIAFGHRSMKVVITDTHKNETVKLIVFAMSTFTFHELVEYRVHT